MSQNALPWLLGFESRFLPPSKQPCQQQCLTSFISFMISFDEAILQTVNKSPQKIEELATKFRAKQYNVSDWLGLRTYRAAY